MLQVRFEETGGALVVTPLVARLDAEHAPDFRKVVGDMARGRSLVVVALSHVASIDASGLAALVSVLRRMAPLGELRLVQPSPAVRAFLARARLDTLFPSYGDAASALTA